MVTVSRRRLLQLAAGAVPAAIVGCALTARDVTEPNDPTRILDLDGTQASLDRVDGISMIRNQVAGGVGGPAQVANSTVPRPAATGWRFSLTDAMVADDLPTLTEFGLMVVVDARSGATGTICALTDARNNELRVVLAAPDTLAVWSRTTELMRIRDPSITLRPCAFAMTLDSSRTAYGFLNGAYVASFTDRIGLQAVRRLSLGADGDNRSFAGVLHQLRYWDHAVSGTTLRRNFDSLGARWEVGIVPLIGGRVSAAAPVPTGLKGSSVVPRATDIVNGSAWQNFWSRWDWQWVRESIDLAIEVGSRSIRIIGDVGAVLLGRIDAATYLRRLDQLLTYCRRRGLTVYYCLLDLRHTPLDRLGEVESLARTIARGLSRHPNVVAVDLCNEVSVIYPQLPEPVAFGFIARWASTIRSETNLPLSVSDIHTGQLIDKITDRAAMSRWREVVDFFDIHVYRPPMIRAGSNFLAPYELATDVPLVFGEAGASRDEDADRVGVYRSIENLANSSDRVRGVYQWGLINDEYGLMTENGRVRQDDVIAVWRSFEPRN
ncbi:hypothetical protein VX037_14870 [Gordonia sp. Z-3]|uniref:hypothetical protein n=1 Tax=Gordonia sp. Z-3 TaxID=3115408 RepID=UPI002E294E8E|nr:hypothetical protein [Gordonia sp. Z-3]MED5802315.1 hypothetical protein [Gordonia sp. Z-3]